MFIFVIVFCVFTSISLTIFVLFSLFDDKLKLITFIIVPTSLKVTAIYVLSVFVL